MKRKNLFLICAVLLLCSLPAGVQAKPERIALKSQKQKTQEALAEAGARQVDFSKITDPEVREAFQALFGALDLPARNMPRNLEIRDSGKTQAK
jgi:hypothetical protein